MQRAAPHGTHRNPSQQTLNPSPHRNTSIDHTFKIPDYWSPEEALAVYDFIDDLLGHIWARYGLRIQELCVRDRITLHDHSQPDLFPPTIPCPSEPPRTALPQRAPVPPPSGGRFFRSGVRHFSAVLRSR